MAIKYTDADDVDHTLETEAGAGGAERPVHGLGAAIVATFTSIKVAVEALAGLIAGGKLGVADASAAAIAALISSSELAVKDATAQSRLLSIKAAVEAVAALIATGRLATSNSALEALISSSTLAVNDATAQTKLDALTPNSSGPFYGQSTVGTTATQLSSQALKAGARVKNLHATQDLYVGGNNSVTNSNGHKLRPGEETPVPCANLNQIWLYGSAASTSYSYLAS